jgi:uncharacterized protein (TIGR02246 family)
MATYAQRHDDNDPEAVVALFTEDARLIARSRVHEGRSEIRAFISNVHDGGRSGKRMKHLLGGSVVHVDGTTAEAATDFAALECLPETPWAVKVAGRYTARLRCDSGEWRFTMLQIDCHMFFRNEFGDPG